VNRWVGASSAAILALLIASSVSTADPVPPWDPEGEGGPSFGILATAELTAAHEMPWSAEEQTSVVLFAGLAGLYSAPGGGAGTGVEAGAEARDYFEGYDHGGFFSVYMGAGSAWSGEGENLTTISAGLKAGTRIHFWKLMNGEFYFGPGAHIPLGSVDSDPFFSFYMGFRTNLML
jgi:hypothetical protein